MSATTCLGGQPSSASSVQEEKQEVPQADQVQREPIMRTVSEELQILCDILMDDATGITWDLYRPNQLDKLNLKIRMALFPESVKVKEEGEYEIVDSSDAILKEKNVLVERVCNSIWSQKRHTSGGLFMSIVYIGLVKEDASGRSALNAKDFVIRPLFRTMKCLDRATGQATGKCCVFVDEFGWVYPNWKSFRDDTSYPDVLIVSPECGMFTRKDNGDVFLDVFRAPKTAEEIEKEKWTNVGLTVGSLGSGALLLGSAFFPVTAPFVWGAVAVGGAVAAITGYQSVAKLVKLNYHEQDISLGDREARAHWLAISGTLLGFAATGATSVMRGAASVGTVSKTMLTVTNTVCGASVFVSGVAVGNNILSVVVDDRPLTTAELLQLSVSLFLFTHSVYNFRTAQQMVRETQTQHLADYKETLSKNGRRNFQKKMNARAKVAGSDGAMGDTIRNLNTSDHYNSNFKDTAAYQSTTGGIENPKVKESLLSPTLIKYAPACTGALLSIYKLVVQFEGKDYWDLLLKIGETLLGRYVNSGLTVEGVIKTIYNLLREEGKRTKKRVPDLLEKFKAQETYENIPSVVKDHFAVLRPFPGPFTCKCCGGARWQE